MCCGAHRVCTFRQNEIPLSFPASHISPARQRALRLRPIDCVSRIRGSIYTGGARATGRHKLYWGEHHMKALSATVSALLVTTVAHSAPQYRLIDVYEDSPRYFFEPSGINANGDIVGTEDEYILGSPALSVQHSTGASMALPPLGATLETRETWAAATNDYGKIVGFAISPQSQSYGRVPVAWYTSGGMEEIGPYPNGTALSATGVANTGQAVGVGLINDVGGAPRAVLYKG